MKKSLHSWKQYMSNPFDITTIDTGIGLISKMAAENKRRWEEMITSTDLTDNSRKAWQTIRKDLQRPTAPKPRCLATGNHVSHQLLVNGRGEMPTKSSVLICPQLVKMAPHWHSPSLKNSTKGNSDTKEQEGK